MLREAQSINPLAAEYGIHPNHLYRWRAMALAGWPRLFSDHAAPARAALQAAHAQQVRDIYVHIANVMGTLVTVVPRNPSVSGEFVFDLATNQWMTPPGETPYPVWATPLVRAPSQHLAACRRETRQPRLGDFNP